MERRRFLNNLKRTKIFLWVFALTILILLWFFIRIDVQHAIAKDYLKHNLYDDFKPEQAKIILKHINGPLIFKSEAMPRATHFQWFLVLSTLDTATFNVNISNNPLSYYFISPRITANANWVYLLENTQNELKKYNGN